MLTNTLSSLLVVNLRGVAAVVWALGNREPFAMPQSAIMVNLCSLLCAHAALPVSPLSRSLFMLLYPDSSLPYTL